MRYVATHLWRNATWWIPLLLLVLPAQAQETEPDTTTVIPLDPVVITALRTPFVLEEVPYAVAVNGQEEIQRAQPGLALDEALFAIPGVQVDNRYNYALGERVSIRGFGARAQFGVRGVKVLLDGVPLTFPDGQSALSNVDLGALGRAEVLRGPASALYGNAAGGIIRLETEEPPRTPLGQQFSATAGGHGLLRLQSTTGGRSGDTSYLLTLSRLAYDGYRSFSTAERFNVNGRVGRTGARSRWHVVGSLVSYEAQNPGSLSEELLEQDRTQAYSNNRRQQTGETGFQGQLGGRWQREVGTGEVSLAAYGLRRQIDNPIPDVIIDLERSVGGVRALYRVPIDVQGVRLQAVVGVEGDVQRDDRQNFVNEEGERGDLVLLQDERVWNGAAFAQLSTSLTPRLHLLGGLRYDYFRFHADDQFVAAGNPDDSGSRTMDAFSPSLGVTYDLAEPLNVYANAATSFETPTTTELVNRPTGAGGFNPELEPQRTRSAEVGARGQIGRRATYQLAAYRAEVDEALISYQVPGGLNRNFFRNTGSAVHQGLEAGLSWAPLRGLLARLAYTYTDARFDAYVKDGVSLADHQIPGVAPHSLEARLSYETPGGWLAAVDGRYLSETPVDDENTAFADSYFVMDARLGLGDLCFGTTRLSAFAGVNNLLDTHYSTSVVVNAWGGRYYEPGPGRTFYAGLTLSLGWHRGE